MRDDQKMFNIGVGLFLGLVFVIEFLQVAYRVQDNNLKSVRRNMIETKQEYDIARTKFSALSSADSLRNSVIGINPKAETVSFSKTLHINNIPMVEQQ